MLKRLSAAFLAMAIAGMSMIVTCAKTAEPVSVLITVNCETENEEDVSEAYIEPVDEDDWYTIKEGQLLFEGSGTKAFALEFTEPGNYYYKIRQSKSRSTAKYFDETTHSVKVSVIWDGLGELTAIPSIHKEGSTGKEMEIEFLNVPRAYYLDKDNKEKEEQDDADESSDQLLSQEDSVSVAPAPVQTGDYTPVRSLFILMVGSGIISLALAMHRKRSR